jgi:hypothetical protein
MLDEIPDSVIADSFREALPRGVRHRHRMIDIAILFLQHPDPIVYQIGCEALLDVASTDDGCTLLTGYGISMQDLFAWTARSDVLGSVERDALMRELIDRVLGIPLVK